MAFQVGGGIAKSDLYYVDIRDHGGYSGATDNTTAFRKALVKALKYSYTSAFGSLPAVAETEGASIFIPPGKWRITGNLTDLVSDGLAKGRMQGIPIFGNGLKSLIFADIGDGNYMFDNFAGTPISSYLSLAFNDLVITGGDTPSTASSFMRAWSNGQADKFHRFNNVLFHNLKTVVRTEGSANADVMKFTHCKFAGIWTSALSTNNTESICHTFYQCEAGGCNADALIHASQGGNVVWSGGSIINGYAAASGGKDSMQYVLQCDYPNNGNSKFHFHGVRFENPSIYSGLVKAEQSGYLSRTVFDTCTWAGVITPDTPRTVVSLAGRHRVEFVRCKMPTGAAVDTFKYSMTSVANDIGSTMKPTIEFDRCEVPPFNSASYVFPNAADGGKVTATGCYNGDVETIVPGDPTLAMDFNWPAGFGGSGIKSSMANIHRVALFRNGTSWPRDVVSAYNEKVVTLPPNATILRIVVRKHAQGSDAATYQLSVGSNDKATVYGSSTSGRYDAAHQIIVADLNLDVGTDTNKRNVRLWHPSVGGSTPHTVGFAYVEYV